VDVVLKPKDIHSMEFRTTFRGYDPEQVDQFIAKLFSEYEALYRESEEQKKTIETLQAKIEEKEKKITDLEGREDSIQGMVTMAKRTVEELLASAKSESEGILASAHREADRIVAEARKEAEHILASAQLDKQSAQRESEYLQRLQERLYYRIQRVLDEAKEALSGIKPEERTGSMSLDFGKDKTRDLSSFATQEIALTRELDDK